jgi:hypothetical protein
MLLRVSDIFKYRNLCIKTICKLLCFITLISCTSHREISRIPSSQSDNNKCSKYILSIIGERSSVEDAIKRQRDYNSTLQSNDFDRHEIIADEELQHHRNIGNDKFLDNGEFVFRESMKEMKHAGGATHAGIFTAKYNGQSFIIKRQARTSFDKTSIVDEIHNLNILHSLGLTPKTYFVEQGGDYFLVMEKLPGINIKEVLSPRWRTSKTRKNIDLMLGQKLGSVKESITSFSKIMTTVPEYQKRLDEIISILEKYGYVGVHDLQFMIDLKSGPSSIQLIDVESFLRSDNPSFGEMSPRNVIGNVYDNLIELAN